MIRQMDLVAGMLKTLDKHGHKTLESFQMNAVIEGANVVMVALKTEAVSARPATGLAAWLKSHDTGQSSEFMAFILAGGPMCGNRFPWDPDDFGRCYRFLEAVPEARARLGEMAKQGKVWAGLVAAWPELTALFLEEWPTKKAPKLYERMQQIIEAGEGRKRA